MRLTGRIVQSDVELCSALRCNIEPSPATSSDHFAIESRSTLLQLARGLQRSIALHATRRDMRHRVIVDVRCPTCHAVSAKIANALYFSIQFTTI